MSRLPKLSNKHKICIICEGNEEYEYLNRLKELKVWSSSYDIILENAGGNGNISARYQSAYQNGSYELVLIFCDTEKKPYQQYEDIKCKINDIHGIYSAAGEVIIFSNPCTMQIVIKHWTDEILKTAAKKVNAPLIEQFTQIKGYKGRMDQIQEMMKYITEENYQNMRNRVKGLIEKDTTVGSSNFGKFLNWLEGENVGWIEAINETLEG